MQRLLLLHSQTLARCLKSMWGARRAGIKEFTEHYNFLELPLALSPRLSVFLPRTPILHHLNALERTVIIIVHQIGSHCFTTCSSCVSKQVESAWNSPNLTSVCLCLPPVKRAPSSHNRHQPPPDGRFCRAFHEASGRFVSPARDQRKGAPGQILVAHTLPSVCHHSRHSPLTAIEEGK